jgi:tRNA A-37 threonylcarbamoyl transferase component Bud32
MSLFLPARLWWGKKRFGDFGLSVVRVSKDRIIKGPCESAELEALKYVAQYTSIPVPKVHRTYHVDGYLYIEMEYIEGETLGAAWFRHLLSSAEKKAVIEELAGCIRQLRLLEPPQRQIIASAEFRQCLDYRIGYAPVGPFLNHEDFHSFLRGHIPLESCTQVYGESVTLCHTRQYRTSFSHADLCPRNIIVRDGKVAAIVDWQFAGWYPEYWEYTKAHFGLMDMPDWYAEFQRAVTRYDDELAAERALWWQFDQPGMAHHWIYSSPRSVEE